MSDRVALDQLMDLVRQSVEAMTRAAGAQEQLLRELRAGMTNDQIPMTNVQ